MMNCERRASRLQQPAAAAPTSLALLFPSRGCSTAHPTTAHYHPTCRRRGAVALLRVAPLKPVGSGGKLAGVGGRRGLALLRRGDSQRRAHARKQRAAVQAGDRRRVGVLVLLGGGDRRGTASGGAACGGRRRQRAGGGCSGQEGATMASS
jgi:hypothetical protein